ncbi:DnaJ domain-containing protein [soil metagenome]
MNWRGKLIGFLLGLLTKRPILMVVGIILGHLYDTGVFSGRGPANQPPPPAASNPYGILGVNESASDDDVEAAYRRLMSEFHPDRVAAAGPEIRELAERRTREANAAYDQIKRQRGR